MPAWTKEEADKIMESAREAINNEKQAAMVELKNQVAILSIEVAEKISKSLSKQASIISVDGELKDLSYELQFKLAYSLFSIDSIQNAKLYFSKIMNSDSKFASTSRYYYAYINYSGGFYQSALASFKKLLNDDKFKNIVPYYISQIYFSQKNLLRIFIAS